MAVMDLRLVPVSARHARDIQALASDAAIARWTAIPHPYPRDGALAFVDRAQRMRARGMQETFAVCEAGGHLLGVATLVRDEKLAARAELGYWIGRPYWGRGYATAAARRLLAHGFERMDLDAVVARCFAINRASARVIEKLGFRFVGLEASRSPKRLAEPVRRHELTRGDWYRATGE
jgi:ribosomal-protein-alanine N-acetyltransferase